jgi:4-alpha-glucanotransferase
MTSDERPVPATDDWGIQTSWVDAHGRPSVVADDILAALRELIGRQPDDLDDVAPLVTRPGRDTGLGRVTVYCEDGTVRSVDSVLPGDFPLGYHTLRREDGSERGLIVSPGRCWLPEDWRAWGWTVQLYAARSRRSWGIGDLADLRALREWSQSLGSGFLLVNPLHAVAPVIPQEDSPYLPVTRRFRNPLYLAVDAIAARVGADVTDFSEQGRALNADPVIDRDAVWRLKRQALRLLFDVRDRDDEFERWSDDQGGSLRDFAVWCALVERHGPDWRLWDEALRDPASEAVREFAAEHAREVTFHAWLQWQLDCQLQDAGAGIILVQDLPIGVSGGGADAWARQDLLARGARIGAPPDVFNMAGQDWGSPPPIPWRLRASGYRALVEAIRATMSAGGGLRVDHVMGLFRLWWVAPDKSPVEGAYVRYPHEDLLDIVALESHRARAIVVGEDLGTVESGVRESLADHNILSYRLLYFETDDPAAWPVKAMAAVTTHDLPTVAGLWTGSDVTEQVEHTSLSRQDAEHGRQSVLEPVTRGSALTAGASASDAVAAAYERLAQAPSVIVSATLDDAMAVERRPNMPGADQRGNWRLALPMPIEDLARDPFALRIAAVLEAAVARRREAAVDGA